MKQERMFRLAVENINLNAYHEPGLGWRLALGVRRGDESWDDVRPDVYDRLSTPELADVITTALAHHLGL